MAEIPPDATEPVGPVGLVLVSHSRALAEGAAELAAQMAPRVVLRAAGGTDDDGLGTSYARVTEAIEATTADGRWALVLTDLGSAVLTAESVLELLDEDVAQRVRLADAPFVEGAVAAAVAANGGADIEGVLAAAEGAGAAFGGVARAHAGPAAAPEVPAGRPVLGILSATVTLRNPLGLHARPAAVVARIAAGFDAQVTVDGVNAASVLELMRLGATGGHELAVEARGPQARQALDAVVAELGGGFGEL